MNRRELNISNKRLYSNTKEDIILKSPFRIPPKGLQDILNLKSINSLDTAYYDISPTENQFIAFNTPIQDLHFNTSSFFLSVHDIQNIKMGNFNG